MNIAIDQLSTYALSYAVALAMEKTDQYSQKVDGDFCLYLMETHYIDIECKREHSVYKAHINSLWIHYADDIKTAVFRSFVSSVFGSYYINIPETVIEQ